MSDHVNHVTTIQERVSSAVTYGSSAGAVFIGLTLNEWVLIVGIVVPILALLGNWVITIYFKQKNLELDREVALARFDIEQDEKS